MNTSISDISSFLRCRRAWDLSSPNRQSLRRIGVTSAALHIGTGVHLGLAAMARKEDWLEAVTVWAWDAIDAYTTEYTARVGAAPSPDELSVFTDSAEKVVALLRRYAAHYQPNLWGAENLTCLFVEQAFNVRINTVHNFVGTWDAILEDTDNGDLWIVEHKTFSKRPNVTDLLLTPQFSAYAWAAQQLFPSRTIAGVLYDGIAKNIPSGPELLKSGKLSQAFNSSSDYMSYLDAIHYHGLAWEDYADILARLKERDAGLENPYWTRYQLRLTPAQIAQTGRDIAQTVTEMASTPRIYPTFRMEGCFDCQVRDLCQTIQHGEDTSWLIQNSYGVHEGSASFRTGREEVEYAEAA